MLPPAFHPPQNPTDEAAWLTWLDANRLAAAAAHMLDLTQLTPTARAHLQAANAQARAQWLVRKMALQHMLRLMACAPYALILLKGAALALTIYGDPAIRPMNDIDILIGPEHLMPVVEQMRKAGFEEHGLAQGEDVGYLHHFIFTDPNTHVRFELHRTLPLLPSDEALNWFLAQTQTTTIEDAPCMTLTPEAQLLHLASHAVLEHGGARDALAIWFYDIDQLIRKTGDDIDWETVLLKAQQLKWEAALQEAIRLAHKLFETPIPAAWIDWLQLSQTRLSGYNTLQKMTSAHRSSSLTAFLILRGLSWRQRGRQLAHMLFPSRSYMQRRYPHTPWLLAYPYRWLGAARKLLPAMLNANHKHQSPYDS